MKSFIPCVALTILSACSPGNKKDQPADSTIVKTDNPATPLTDAQKAEGWKMLFDGRTLTGWHIYQHKENNSWEVVDGTLHCKPPAARKEDKRSDLVTDGQYENFELSLEWKVAPKGNSGIIYRTSEDFDQPYLSGAEYQAIDDSGYPEDLKDWQKSGANYAMNAPNGAVLKPVGDWNSSKIVARGNHVEHWLNGVKVVEYEQGSEDWKIRKAKGKWKDAVNYGAFTKGHIDLQDHDTESSFRNIMIKEL